MKLAAAQAVSWETFWGDYALVFGSMLVLCSLMQTKMPKGWTRKLTAFGTCFLAVGTTFTAIHDFHAYGEKHALWAILAFSCFIVTLICLLAYFLCANIREDIPGNENEGKKKEYGRRPARRGPVEDAKEQAEHEVDAAEQTDENGDGFIGDSGEVPVQPVKKTPSDAGKGERLRRVCACMGLWLHRLKLPRRPPT